MDANETNKEKIIYKELSYIINGLLFGVHNREKALPVEIIDNQQTNRVDFIVDEKILVDIKAKDCITKDDYRQMQRYLEASKKKLGILANFRNRYLHPIRVIRIDS